MAIIRIPPQPRRRQPAWILPPRRELPALRPDDWKLVLTAVPGPRWPWISYLTALVAALFVAGLLFSASVIIIQPFFLLFYSTLYPNLATVSFTSITLAVLGLGLASLTTLAFILRLPVLATALKVFTGLAAGLVTVGFFYLLSKEIVVWVLTSAGVTRFLNAWLDFFQKIL